MNAMTPKKGLDEVSSTQAFGNAADQDRGIPPVTFTEDELDLPHIVRDTYAIPRVVLSDT